MTSPGPGRKFQFIREIASGGFGTVYLVKVVHADGFARIAALKLLHEDWSSNQDVASRMRDEARLLGWLRHRHIVDVLDLTRINGRVAVIMEYLEAIDGKVILQAVADGKLNPMPVGAVLEVGVAVASALDAAYNRPPYPGEKPLHVIHRDIKPSNVMMDANGGVKVLDFGVARAEFDTREAKTQEMTFGSIEYMPPERLFFEPDTSNSDVYSLGATLYELLCGEKFGRAQLKPEVFKAAFEERWVHLAATRQLGEVAVELHELLARMMAFESEDRLSAAEAIVRLRALARRSPGASLAEWAEAELPPIIEAFTGRPMTPSSDSLMGQTLAEDSRGFSENGVVALPPGAGTRAAPEDLDDSPLPARRSATAPGNTPVGGHPRSDRTPVGRTPGAQTSAGRTPGRTSPGVPRLDPGHTLASSGGRRDSRSSEGSSRAPLFAAVAFGLLMLSMGALVLAIVVGNAGFSNAPAQNSHDTAPPVEPEVVTGARFVSALPGTKKITVVCGDKKADGPQAVSIALSSHAECSVEVVDAERTRWRAKVKNVEYREYRCFENNDKMCK